MNILETDHWCLLLPPEWSADYDDDVVRISDADEVLFLFLKGFEKFLKSKNLYLAQLIKVYKL